MQRSSRFTVVFPTFVAALVSVAAPVAAQESETRRNVVVRIVDEASNTPLAGAAVELIGRNRAYLTDAEGRVTIPRVEGERARLRVTLLGYGDVDATLDVPDEGAVRTLRMTPRPVVLEAIQVQTNRLRARRNAVATSVRAYDRERLAHSAAWDVADFLRTYAFVRPVSCPGGLQPHDCAYVRGRPQPVTVYIDEMPVFGGLEFLDTYPTEEMYLIEVYGGGRQIRVYTNYFMERVAEGRAFISPVLW